MAISFRATRRLWPIHAAAVLLFLGGIARFYDETGFTRLIEFSQPSNATIVPALASLPKYVGRRGYDGQFYVQMAVDPLLRDPLTDRAMDKAPLRARRILFCWTAYALGLGRPAWIMQAYALQNVAAWLLLAIILLRWFPPDSVRATAAWLACLFSAGLIWSARASLLDGPSLALIAIGIAALEAGWPWISAAVFAIAGLGRETNLLTIAAQVQPDRKAWRSMALQCILILIPFAVWLDYIRSIYRSTVFTTGEMASAPLAGYLGKWEWIAATVRAGDADLGTFFSTATIFALTLQAILLAARPTPRDPWWRLGIAYGLLMFTLPPVLWGGALTTVVRVVLPMTVAFNIALVRRNSPRSFWPLFAAGNLTVLQGTFILAPTLWRWFR